MTVGFLEDLGRRIVIAGDVVGEIVGGFNRCVFAARGLKMLWLLQVYFGRAWARCSRTLWRLAHRPMQGWRLWHLDGVLLQPKHCLVIVR